MNFNRRLRLFLLGVGIGSLVVWAALFRGRTFPAWTPEGRILEALQQSPVKISPSARCMLDCNSISDQDILSVLQTADVKFDESDIHGKPVPEYVLQGKGLNGKTYKMKFKSEYPSSYLLAVMPNKDAGSRCDCK